MITRSYKALTSRPVFVLAAALATLVLARARGVRRGTSEKFDYPENGTDPVATFSRDGSGRATRLSGRWSGPDADRL